MIRRSSLTRVGARHVIMLVFLAFLSLGLVGCDSFSLLDQFARIDGTAALQLTLQKDTVQPRETIDLYPSGGVPPYSFGLVADDLYYDAGLGSVAEQKYTAGDSIGKVEIHLSDGRGGVVNSVVTIIPPAPDNFTAQAYVATSGNKNGIELQWTYTDTALISGFLLQRSTDGGTTFPDSQNLSSSLTSYVDSTASNRNTTYTYRLYAVANLTSGTIQSLSTAYKSANP